MKSSIIAAAAAGCALAVVPGLAVAAAAPADVTVTIKAEGTDMFGTVKSTKPALCAANRTVKVFKLVDGEPHLWATDTTDLQNGVYVWSTGNTGTEGRFFAKVPKKDGCEAAKSPTIRVQRNP